MKNITTYKVFKGLVDLPDYLCKYIVTESKKGGLIFNNEKNDNKRSQHDFKCTIGNHLKRVLNTFIKTKGFIHHTVQDLVIVRSEACCKRQQLHYDYDTNKLKSMYKKDYPYGLIVSVSDNSRFIIKPNNSKAKIVYLNKGDVLIFRGDLLHAGAEYYNENIRLHAYIDSKKYKREKNTTYKPSLSHENFR